LKTIFQNNRPFFIFLATFFLAYGILFGVYQMYLGQFDVDKFETDSFTISVSNQTSQIIKWFGYESRVEPHQSQPCYKLLVNEKYMVRVVEGCNAASLMVLFVAFILAFKGTWKRTIGYIIFGLIAIHILNVFRIAFITIGLYHYPHLQHILHDILFPLIIYGTIFLLWVGWVTKWSNYAKK